MNHRERVRRAVELDGPDRVPITHVTLPGAELRYGQRLADLYARYPADSINVGAASQGEWGPEIGVPHPDSWGALWVRHTDEHKGQVEYSPLADWADMASFVPPDTASDAVVAAIKERIRGDRNRHYILADGDTLWQRMFYLHGYQATLIDLLVEPQRCAELRDMILQVMLRRVHRLCSIPGLDGLHFRDDWGTQSSLMIAPDLWRSFFKPAYAQLFQRVRAAGRHVWFHSDGDIAEIIPDLIEIGVQVLNPQVPVVGRQRLAQLCGGRVCIEGDIDRQWLLPHGTPKQVREAVRLDVAAFGQGYIGRGEMAGDVPLENLDVMLNEFARARHMVT